MTQGRTIRAARGWTACLAVLLVAQSAGLAAQTRRATSPALRAEAPRPSLERSGIVPAREGQRLRLVTDTGNVRIRTSAAGGPWQVSYRVRIETSPGPEAQKLLQQFVVAGYRTPEGVSLTGRVPWRSAEGGQGRLWVSFDVEVPRNYHVSVQTGAGNIELGELAGSAALLTNGGNINAGRLGATSRLETAGGHISVEDVAGDLTASTAGGHITAGKIEGNAVLRSAGGHIAIASAEGSAQLETGGGNISIRRAARVAAMTAGGRIEVGETAGPIRAKTGGGGIRVLQVAGPTELEATGGSIYLTKVLSPVRASTTAGNITAWFVPSVKLTGGSQLECSRGDIVVYIPRELAVTIDAVIEMPAQHRIEIDPAMTLKVKFAEGGEGRVVRAEGALNGGGEVLRLRTSLGNIKLRLADTGEQLQLHQRLLQMQLENLRRQLESQENIYIFESEQAHERLAEQARRQAESAAGGLKQQREQQGRWTEWKQGVLDRFRNRVEVSTEGENLVPVRMRLPDYPPLARQARVAGPVKLQLRIGADGRVEEARVLSGHALLAPAALEAAREWRYPRPQVDGRAARVVTNVTVNFKLQ